MTRLPSALAGPATLALTLALLAPAVPVQADGLPDIRLAPGFDCSGGDAGNSYAEASYLYAHGASCTGTLAPVVDEQDWYAFFASAGTWVHLGAFSNTGDADMCVFSPADDTTPLACSTHPPLAFDDIDFVAEESGDYRLQLYLATGPAVYGLYLFDYPPPPPVLPDFAVWDLRVEKPMLRADGVESGVPSPVGSWRISAMIGNVAGEGWDCPEVYVSIQGRPLVGPTDLGVTEVYSVGLGATIHPAYPDCFGPGETRRVVWDWRPVGVVGDVDVTVDLYPTWDAVWENNHAATRDFVLVGGV